MTDHNFAKNDQKMMQIKCFICWFDTGIMFDIDVVKYAEKPAQLASEEGKSLESDLDWWVGGAN